tara:strand:+ start:8500 stop:8724 length:225 start_codon:yes stop_codon:yes gene_type:complete
MNLAFIFILIGLFLIISNYNEKSPNFMDQFKNITKNKPKNNNYTHHMEQFQDTPIIGVNLLNNKLPITDLNTLS